MIILHIEMGVAVFSGVFEEVENSTADRSRSVFRNSLSGAADRSSTVESNEANRFSAGFLFCAFIVMPPTNPAFFEQFV
jgi:hypothetical protein